LYTPRLHLRTDASGLQRRCGEGAELGPRQATGTGSETVTSGIRLARPCRAAARPASRSAAGARAGPPGRPMPSKHSPIRSTATDLKAGGEPVRPGAPRSTALRPPGSGLVAGGFASRGLVSGRAMLPVPQAGDPEQRQHGNASRYADEGSGDPVHADHLKPGDGTYGDGNSDNFRHLMTLTPPGPASAGRSWIVHPRLPITRLCPAVAGPRLS